VGTLLCAGPSQAPFYTGEDLYQKCLGPNGACPTYIYGVADAYDALAAAGLTEAQICLPRPANSEVVRDVVMQHLYANPDTRHQDAGGLVPAALMGEFPC
jgi:hypothetical protein